MTGWAQSTGVGALMADIQAAGLTIADIRTRQSSLEEDLRRAGQGRELMFTAQSGKPSARSISTRLAASSAPSCIHARPGDLRLALFSWCFGAAIAGGSTRSMGVAYGAFIVPGLIIV